MGIVTTTEVNQSCIDICNKCFQACYECLKACMNSPDVASRVTCMSTLLECAKICELSSSFMTMNATHAVELCNLCSTICEKCASECGKFMFTDEHCQKCADICNQCADECKKMSGMLV